MRLWSLHPRFLDGAGLVACWREALLARKVLRGETVGYRSHPQLDRFKNTKKPLATIEWYLILLLKESRVRGYNFDPAKISFNNLIGYDFKPLYISEGQLLFEFEHLQSKLKTRNPQRFRENIPDFYLSGTQSRSHLLFRVSPSSRIAHWERGMEVLE